MAYRLFSRALITALGVVALSLTACSKPVTREVKVPGNVGWTDTGVDVKVGQRVVIVAKGEVAADKATRTGPGGFASKPEWKKYNVVADAPHMALIGKVGPTGGPVMVGPALSVDAPVAGRIFLGINDRDTKNNVGAFQVTITVQ